LAPRESISMGLEVILFLTGAIMGLNLCEKVSLGFAAKWTRRWGGRGGGGE
jgi:hypothetical protein